MQRKNNNGGGNGGASGQMIQRLHRWRQKRKNYLDNARQTADPVERERLLQMAEHYGRIVSDEQGKIDVKKEKKREEIACPAEPIDSVDDDADDIFPDFLTQLNQG